MINKTYLCRRNICIWFFFIQWTYFRLKKYQISLISAILGPFWRVFLSNFSWENVFLPYICRCFDWSHKILIDSCVIMLWCIRHSGFLWFYNFCTNGNDSGPLSLFDLFSCLQDDHIFISQNLQDIFSETCLCHASQLRWVCRASTLLFWAEKSIRHGLHGWLIVRLVVGFYGTFTFVGYLTPNPFLYK